MRPLSGSLICVGAVVLLPYLASCTTLSVPTPSDSIPASGYLRVNEPLPLTEYRNGSTQSAWLDPGYYGSSVSQFSDHSLTLDFGPQAPGLITIELKEEAEALPVRGGSFDVPATAHNQPFAFSGNYSRVEELVSVRNGSNTCVARITGPVVCRDVVDSEGQVRRICQPIETYVYGTERVEVTTTRIKDEFFVKFVDPETSEELARFVESRDRPTQVRTRSLSPCRPNSGSLF